MSLEYFNKHFPLIDPTAWVHPSAVLIGQVKLAENSSVWPTAVLRADDGRIELGPNVNVQDGAVLHLTHNLSHTILESNITVGHKAILHGCIIKSNCLIGMGSIILDNAEIGSNCVVGAGALITANKKFPAGSLILGSPAKVARPLTEQEIESIQQSWQYYVQKKNTYQREWHL